MKQLYEYIHLMKGVLPEEFCDDAIKKYSGRNDWIEHAWTSYDPNKTMNISTRRDKELLNLAFEGEHLDYLSKKCNQWISSYMNRHPEHIQIRHTSEFRINRYVTGTSMSVHSDNIVSLFETGSGSPVLSIVGCLNNDYEGGEFIMFDDLKINIKKGDVLIFPSAFMYRHRVETVTKGERWSFVTWAF